MKTNPSAAATPRAAVSTQAVPVTLLWCLLGLLVPRATLYGEMAPFGIGLAAAMGSGRLPVLAALAVGYLLADPVLLPLRYIATVAVVGGARWVLAALPELDDRPFVPSALAFVSTAVTGLIILGQTGLDSYRVLLILAESAVAAGSALFFRVAVDMSRRRLTPGDTAPLTPQKQTAVILSGAVVIMAAGTLEVQGFAPGRVVAALLVLALARTGREAGGCLAGVILGAAVALGQPGQTAPAVALAFGGLLAGLFSRFGKLAQAGIFLLAAGVVTLAEVDDTMLIHMYELFAAGVLFALLPKSADRWLTRLFIRGGDLPAVQGIRRLMTMRLQVAGSAMDEVAGSLAGVSERLSRHSAPDVAAIYRRCRDTVCTACPLHTLCWEQHPEELTLALEQLTPLLEKQGYIDPEQLTGYLRQQCRHAPRLADSINRGYNQYMLQQNAWQRLREIQGAVQDQFRGTGQLLQDMAGQLEDPRQVDTELSGRVLAVCSDFGMPVQDALCTRSGGNRLTVDILTRDVGVRLDRGRWLREIRAACDRDFAPPSVGEWGEHIRITLTEKPRYTLETGITQLCCDGEKLCGDAVEVFSLEGRTVAVLSDGMGSGGRAAVDGTIAVGITSRLWKAGFSPASILQTVNASLLVKSREESFATLDVAVVDAFSGRLDSYKAGAASSLLCSGGRVSRLERPSLPVGILPDIRFEHSHDWLAAGDILLLLSDGALSDGLAPVEELLRDHPPQESMQALADKIAAAARAAGQQHPDDITVVALRLHRAAEA